MANHLNKPRRHRWGAIKHDFPTGSVLFSSCNPSWWLIYNSNMLKISEMVHCIRHIRAPVIMFTKHCSTIIICSMHVIMIHVLHVYERNWKGVGFNSRQLKRMILIGSRRHSFIVCINCDWPFESLSVLFKVQSICTFISHGKFLLNQLFDNTLVKTWHYEIFMKQQ